MKKVILYAPESYNAVERKRCNGCGAGWNTKIVPDNLIGCDITEACNIHDYMYEIGQTEQDKQEADSVFINNMTRLIKAYSKCKIMLLIRLKLARIYYDFVKNFGGAYFWDGKNRKENTKEIFIK